MTAWPWKMVGETEIGISAGDAASRVAMETVTALPSAVTVKAAGRGGLDCCRSSEKESWSICPALLTTELDSVGGVVSAAPTTMSKVSLTAPPLPSLAVTFTSTVPTSAAAGVPEKMRVLVAKFSHVGSGVLSDCVAM